MEALTPCTPPPTGTGTGTVPQRPAPPGDKDPGDQPVHPTSVGNLQEEGKIPLPQGQSHPGEVSPRATSSHGGRRGRSPGAELCAPQRMEGEKLQLQNQLSQIISPSLTG